MRKALYGHTSLETSYLIADYPYGSLRCQRRVWIESSPKHGFRFVAQTQNPKNGRWNKPHKSTYIEVAACLYLDENNHVHMAGVGAYTDAEQALDFVLDFGKGCLGFDDLKLYAAKKKRFSQALASGEAFFTINGQKQERSETEIERDNQNAAKWGEVVALIDSL